MQNENKTAWIICLASTLIIVLGIVLGLFFSKPLIIAFSIVPAIIYEAYRTKGFFTKLASIISAVVIIAEIYVIIVGKTVNLSKYLGGFANSLPWLSSDIHAGLIGPVVLVICSIVLFKWTAGKFTRWLAVIILVSSVALFYSIDPGIFKGFIKSKAVQENIKEGIRKNIR